MNIIRVGFLRPYSADLRKKNTMVKKYLIERPYERNPQEQRRSYEVSLISSCNLIGHATERKKRNYDTQVSRSRVPLFPLFDPLPRRLHYRPPVDVAKTRDREGRKGNGERTARNEKWEQKK